MPNAGNVVRDYRCRHKNHVPTSDHLVCRCLIAQAHGLGAGPKDIQAVNPYRIEFHKHQRKHWALCEDSGVRNNVCFERVFACNTASRFLRMLACSGALSLTRADFSRLVCSDSCFLGTKCLCAHELDLLGKYMYRGHTR